MSIFMNHLKHLFFVSKNLFQNKSMENRKYKNGNTERKYLNITRKNQFLKVKNSLLEFEKDFIDLKDIELKYRELKERSKNYFSDQFSFLQKI